MTSFLSQPMVKAQFQINPIEETDPGSLEMLIQRRVSEDIWQDMWRDLPCAEVTEECINQMQEKAVSNVTILGEIKAAIQQAQISINSLESYPANRESSQDKKQTICEILSPLLKYYLTEDRPFSEVERQPGDEDKKTGPIERIISDIVNPRNLVSNFLLTAGFDLIESIFGGGDEPQIAEPQVTAVEITYIKAAINELKIDVAEIEQAIKDKVQLYS